MKNFFGLLIMTLLFVGCSNQKQDASADLIHIDVFKAFETQKDVKVSEFIEKVEFIPLESTMESWFGSGTDFSVGEKYILALDYKRRRTVLFDLQGNFIRTIGKQGKGPGELMEVREITMGPKEEFVFIYDVAQRKLVKYDVNGDFIKEVYVSELTPSRYIKRLIFINGEEFILANYRPYQPMDGFVSLPVFDLDLNHVRDILPRANDNNLRINVEPHAFVLQNPDRITFWEPFLDTLYTISSEGEAIPTHVIGFSQGGPDRHFIETNINPNLYSEHAIVSVLDAGGYLHIFGMKNNNWFTALYNQKTEGIYQVSADPECNITDYARNYGYENDLFGASRMMLRQYSKKADRFVSMINLETFSDYYDLDCIRKKQVKFPELRDRFLELVQDPEARYQKLIVLMKGKSK